MLGNFNTDVAAFDRLAYELRLFGAFTADVVVGDWARNAYCFVEFEDGRPDSIFRQSRVGTSEWSPRFEHGFGQIVDWFWKINDLRGSTSLAETFGASTIEIAAVLVAGRDAYLTETERTRLEWRRRHVLVDSRHVFCCTFDELERILRRRLELFMGARQAE